jgi:hypothetical protein
MRLPTSSFVLRGVFNDKYYALMIYFWGVKVFWARETIKSARHFVTPIFID